MSEATITLPMQVVRMMFAASNHLFGEPTAFQVACDVIEHAAMELRTVHDALCGTPSDSQELAVHAYRASEHIKAGLEIVKILEKAQRESGETESKGAS